MPFHTDKSLVNSEDGLASSNMLSFRILFSFFPLAISLLGGVLILPQEAIANHHEDLRLRYWVPKKDYRSLEKPPLKLIQWMDYSHSSVGEQIRLSARNFDGLFGKPDDDDSENNSRILTRTGVLKEEGEDPSPLLRFSAKLDLPKIKKRWKLLVDSTTETFFTKTLTGTRDPFRVGEAGDTDDQVITTALRWSIIEDVRQILNIDIGAKLRASPKAYVKANYLKRWPLSDKLDMVFNQHVFGVINDDSGSSTSLDFNRNINEELFYRIHHRYTRLFKDNFSTWQVSHSLYQTLSKRASIAYHVSVSGEHDDRFYHNDFGLAVQYKRNFFRPWMWLFIEPEMHFPRSRDWRRTHQITLGIEALFGAI